MLVIYYPCNLIILNNLIPVMRTLLAKVVERPDFDTSFLYKTEHKDRFLLKTMMPCSMFASSAIGQELFVLIVFTICDL